MACRPPRHNSRHIHRLCRDPQIVFALHVHEPLRIDIEKLAEAKGASRGPASDSVVIADLDIICVSLFPDETDAPLPGHQQLLKLTPLPLSHPDRLTPSMNPKPERSTNESASALARVISSL